MKMLLAVTLFSNAEFTSPLNLHGNYIVLFCSYFLIKLLAPVHAISNIYQTRIF